MHDLPGRFRTPLIAAVAAAAMLASGCGTMEKMGWGGKSAAGAAMTGEAEVPPVTTKASGISTIKVAEDRSVSGSVKVEGMTPTAAHIHQGASGSNGPVIITLSKASERTFNVPADAKLTDAQYGAYKKGNLYVNVHSAAHPGGEVRVQMKP